MTTRRIYLGAGIWVQLHLNGCTKIEVVAMRFFSVQLSPLIDIRLLHLNEMKEERDTLSKGFSLLRNVAVFG